MVKTHTPVSFVLPSGEAVTADAMPDAFDERDLAYVPRLDPLPPVLDQREDCNVRTQQGNSCTGHALATMIETTYAGPTLRPQNDEPPRRVSPYMLYHFARRYDEFAGETDIGSSLRGAFKGWMRNGVALDAEWPLFTSPELNLDDAEVRARCSEQPLGAYFRINTQRLDDMQSAINELRAIAVSAAIHDGWVQPVPLANQLSEKPVFVIRRRVDSQPRGGHAFTIVGYNRIGFLVQNSWGTTWGKGGFATLPYEDWLENAYDAWAARPGVPATPPYRLRNATVQTTGGGLAQGQGPDVRRLAPYVVNVADDGKLSRSGQMTSTPRKIDALVQTMERQHDAWARASGNPAKYKRRIVLYAHGGLVKEAGGLSTAERHLSWWLRNQVYPVSFAWESGAIDTLLSALKDVFGVRLPFGGLREDAEEGWDRFVEGKARPLVTPLWQVMKENGREASAPLSGSTIDWQADRSEEPGASLFVERLRRYIDRQVTGSVEVHLVGHSAGSVFLGALLNRLIGQGIKVESLQLLGAAMTSAEFSHVVVPNIGRGLNRVSVFNLSEKREQDDKCPGGFPTLYFKSLLYFVSRSLEKLPNRNVRETPMVGLEKSLGLPMSDVDPRLLREVLDPSRVVISPTPTDDKLPPPDSRSQAVGHGDLDNEMHTLTSVLMRLLGSRDLTPARQYQAYAPPPPGLVEPVIAAGVASLPGMSDVSVVATAPVGVDGAPMPMGAGPVEQVVPETVAVAAPMSVGSGAFADRLEDEGWRPAAPAAQTGNEAVPS